jgi:hypothetical protein
MEDQNNKNLKMSDDLIAHVAKTLQVALITGTDIVDNLRVIELNEKEGQLFLTKDCEENFNKNLETLMSEIPSKNSPFSS